MRTRSNRKKFLKKLYLASRHLILLPLLWGGGKKVRPADDEIRAVAVLRFDRIGDMVLTTPLLKGLKQKYPRSRLIVVASERNQDVIRHDPSVDEIIVFRGYALTAHLLKKAGVDLVVDPFYTYEMRQARLTRQSGARYRLGFSCAGREIYFNIRGPGISVQEHMSWHLARLASSIGIDIEGHDPQLYVTPEEKAWALEYLGKLGVSATDLKIALHPGAFYPSQRWSMEGFAKIGAFIAQQAGAHVFLFGDRSEEKLLCAIHDRIDHNRVTVFCDMNLRHVIALLAECDLLVGNNSGLLHVASGLNVPTVSIVGPTDFVLWQPCGRGHTVIRHPVPCSPCSRAICEDHWCMKAISPGDIERAVSQQLDRIRQKRG